jgi:hypothetical protein
MQLVRGETFETLVAEIQRAFDSDARLKTRLACALISQLYIRAYRPLTRTSARNRGGVAELHGWPCSRVIPTLQSPATALDASP